MPLYEESLQQWEDLMFQKQLFYGEIAEKVEPKYGIDTLRCLAIEINIDYNELINCRDLYRIWRAAKDVKSVKRDLFT